MATVKQLEARIEALENKLSDFLEPDINRMWDAVGNHATHIERILEAWNRHQRQHEDTEFKVTID